MPVMPIFNPTPAAKKLIQEFTEQVGRLRSARMVSGPHETPSEWANIAWREINQELRLNGSVSDVFTRTDTPEQVAKQVARYLTDQAPDLGRIMPEEIERSILPRLGATQPGLQRVLVEEEIAQAIGPEILINRGSGLPGYFRPTVKAVPAEHGYRFTVLPNTITFDSEARRISGRYKQIIPVGPLQGKTAYNYTQFHITGPYRREISTQGPLRKENHILQSWTDEDGILVRDSDGGLYPSEIGMLVNPRIPGLRWDVGANSQIKRLMSDGSILRLDQSRRIPGADFSTSNPFILPNN